MFWALRLRLKWAKKGPKHIYAKEDELFITLEIIEKVTKTRYVGIRSFPWKKRKTKNVETSTFLLEWTIL